jgi:hypothetical protein
VRHMHCVGNLPASFTMSLLSIDAVEPVRAYFQISSSKGCFLITVDQTDPYSRSNGTCETALVSSEIGHDRQ